MTEPYGEMSEAAKLAWSILLLLIYILLGVDAYGKRHRLDEWIYRLNALYLTIVISSLLYSTFFILLWRM